MLAVLASYMVVSMLAAVCVRAGFCLWYYSTLLVAIQLSSVCLVACHFSFQSNFIVELVVEREIISQLALPRRC